MIQACVNRPNGYFLVKLHQHRRGEETVIACGYLMVFVASPTVVFTVISQLLDDLPPAATVVLPAVQILVIRTLRGTFCGVPAIVYSSNPCPRHPCIFLPQDKTSPLPALSRAYTKEIS